MFNSGNPALQYDRFRSEAVNYGGAAVMTVQGAIVKSAILTSLLLAAGGVGFVVANPVHGSLEAPARFGLMIGSAIGALICAIILMFSQKAAPILAPIYAVLEGVFIGAISGIYAELWNGIILQAALLTVGIMVAMFIAYSSGLIRATPFVTKAIVIATAGVCLVYFATFILRLLGVQEVNYLHSGGTIGIAFSLIVVGIASFNFILDFALIERGAQARAPKYMEWYAAYGLLVTIVWLYLEILRLLAKLRSND
ncbi:MAG: Bax inhibitor-1/YccA family protein [Gemmataceae bacterium]